MTGLVFVSSRRTVVRDLATARAGRDALITVIVADGEGSIDVDGVAVIDIGPRSITGLQRALDRSVVTRTLVRLSPADGGVRLARQVRRNAQARHALAQADTIIACDRDAILSVWRAAHRDEAVLGLYGVAAGIAVLRRR